MQFLSLLLAVVPSVIASISPRADYIIHEKRAADPGVDWVNVGRVEPDRILPMRFGLRQQNLHMLEDMLMSVSHPESPSYGKHMTAAEVTEAFAPSDETIVSVVQWMSEFGLLPDRLRLTQSKGWVEVNATIAEVEELLNTEYHAYIHPESGMEQIGCHSYSVPAHIRDHIDLIGPTVQFNHDLPTKRPSDLHKRVVHMHLATKHNSPSSKAAASPNPSNDLVNCSQTITPDCLRALYSIDYTPVGFPDNKYGIAEFQSNSVVAKDLDIFYNKYAPHLVGSRPEFVSVDGGKLSPNLSFAINGESDLDVQYATAVVGYQNIVLMQVEGSFNDWLDAVDASFCTFEGGDDPSIGDSKLPINQLSCGIIKPPNVVSVSWGRAEISTGVKSAERQCAEYGKLGLQGTSILYSSGDSGVAGSSGCLTADGSEFSKKSDGIQFIPQFPVSCPYVTAVGATQMKAGATVQESEVVCADVIQSGGGFSNLFGLPAYQAEAVTNYLKQTPPPYTSHQYNNSRRVRAYPDISANGHGYDVVTDGKFGEQFGTSASSPVVGAMISLINDARIAIGKGPIGFLNPSIYSSSFASAFNDITEGSNPGCGTKGFAAANGWDPATGVGTPNFSKLLPLFLNLP